jgi:phosphoribosylanthranilate isomerase
MSFFAPGPPVRVKVCGITCPEDAECAIAAGADALGFNFFPGSKRHLIFEEARDWIGALAGRVDRVAVVVNAGSDACAALRDSGCFEAIQFHGDEAPGDCTAAGFPLWIRAVRVQDARSIEAARAYPTDFLLLDSWLPGAYGGTGRRLNWDTAREAVLAWPDRRFVLAGGLTPDNVREAIRIVRPHGVDVAGGVESEPRRKDEYLLREFLRAAREAI